MAKILIKERVLDKKRKSYYHLLAIANIAHTGMDEGG